MRPFVVPLLIATLLGGLVAAVPAVPAQSDEQAHLINRVLFGAHVGTDPDNWRRSIVDEPEGLAEYEERISSDLQVISVFHGVGDAFPTAVEKGLTAAGDKALLVSLDMGAASRFRFSAWSDGAHDAYLRHIGLMLADYPNPVYLRPWPEMNGDWVPFQPTATGGKPAGGTPAQFRRAWRHVVDVVRSAGATNVRWVFNPTTDTYRETTDVRDIFPGSAWVDVLGLDGYNWGTYPGWREFADIFAEQYRRLTGLGPGLPVWVAEFGSREPKVADGAPIEPEHSKADWLRRALLSRGFPRIQALVYFDAKKERDWRLASSPESLAAARSLLGGRPAPASRGSLAALGVAGLAPTLRHSDTGAIIVGWGSSRDPGTASYQLQRRTPGHSRWLDMYQGQQTQAALDPTLATAGEFRVRGLDKDGHIRWGSAILELGTPASATPSPSIRKPVAKHRDRKARRRLVIRVRGARLHKRARIRVIGTSGPARGQRYRIRVRKKRTLRGLPPGKYRVRALRISRGQRIAKARPSRRTVRVTRSGPTRAKFRYRIRSKR